MPESELSSPPPEPPIKTLIDCVVVFVPSDTVTIAEYSLSVGVSLKLITPVDESIDNVLLDIENTRLALSVSASTAVTVATTKDPELVSKFKNLDEVIIGALSSTSRMYIVTVCVVEFSPSDATTSIVYVVLDS